MTTHTTPEATELEQILQSTLDDLRETDTNPTEHEVEYDGNELWGYIWISKKPQISLDDRKQTTMRLLRDRIKSDADILPTSTNINFGDAGDFGVAVWWS